LIALYLNHGAGRQFLEDIKVLFVQLTNQEYLEPLLPASTKLTEDKKTRAGWTLTQKGNDLFFLIYQDVAHARGQFDLTSKRLKSLGVQEPLVVNLNSQSKGTDIRSRLGATWPAQYRNAILHHVNSFQYLPTTAKDRTGRLALALVRNSVRSPAHKNLLLARVLGLAQFCGFGEVSLTDLIELIANACHYERIARRYLAAMLGVHYSIFTGYGLADSLCGRAPGSLENPSENFAQLAPKFYESLEPVGMVQNGKPKITRENDITNIRFSIDRGTPVKEMEPIYMISGWASVIFRRPKQHPRFRSTARDFTVGLVRDVALAFVPPVARIRVKNMGNHPVFKSDVHGNSCYYSTELEKIRVNFKRTPGGQLVGKVAQFGDFKPPRFGGQAVFGMLCGCEKDTKKIIRGSKMNGCSLLNLYRFRFGDRLFYSHGKVVYLWSSGDLPLILHLAESFLTSIYVQVANECVYCATSRAIGMGCSIIVAGGW
jgi:hypothetical protein